MDISPENQRLVNIETPAIFINITIVHLSYSSVKGDLQSPWYYRHPQHRTAQYSA